MFNDIIKSIIKLSGGSADKINLEDFMEEISHSFMGTPWNYWMGVKIVKTPLDMMILQEIIFEKKPETIIECGTLYGGSAFYMAHLMDLMNINGKIITIDTEEFPTIPHLENGLINMGGKMVSVEYKLYQPLPTHPKIKYLHSDCLSAEIPRQTGKTMVILDCDHSAEHVYKELEKFSALVSIGQYIIVEDTDAPDRKNGPAFAVERFLKSHKNFKVDKSREKFGVSSNLGGYLLRIL